MIVIALVSSVRKDVMKTSSGRQLVLVGLAVAVLLTASGCSYKSIIEKTRSRLGLRRSTMATPTRVALIVTNTALARATEVPTRTLAPTMAAPTKQLTKPTPTPRPGELFTLPAEANANFVIDLTEAEINQYLVGKTFEQQGLTVRDAQIVLQDNEIVCTLKATHEESGLSGGMTVRGVASAVEGMAYFRVTDIALDKSFAGFARLVAKATIEEAIKQYSTPQGIPIPNDSIEVKSVQVTPGKIHITGRTR
jgi:hypothetical protein